MNCPYCTQPLQPLSGEVYACPQRHGVLMSGTHLAAKSQSLASKIDTHEGSAVMGSSTKPSICPHCTGTMVAVDYNSTGVEIESCESCRFRWLDHGEYRKLVDHRPQLNPEDVLFLSELDKEMEQSETGEQDELRESQDGWNESRAIAAGNSGRTLYLLAGTAVTGLARSALKKPILLLPVIAVVGIILGGLFLFQQQLNEIINSF